MDKLFALESSKEPLPDIAICSQCCGCFPVEECNTEQDGDWESGYYDIHLCPKCDDGGCIDDYAFSEIPDPHNATWDDVVVAAMLAGLIIWGIIETYN